MGTVSILTTEYFSSKRIKSKQEIRKKHISCLGKVSKRGVNILRVNGLKINVVIFNNVLNRF